MRISRAAIFAAAIGVIAISGAVFVACGGSTGNGAHEPGGANPCGANPCGANPCGANPCGANPCGANPCGANPCGANPCGANPCGASPGAGAMVDPAEITEPDGFELSTHGMKDGALLARGMELWQDTSLSKTGALACATCHKQMALFKPSFATSYPHEVAMATEKAGVDAITATEMVQFCMKVPMQTEALDWDGADLAALTRAVLEQQKAFAARGR